MQPQGTRALEMATPMPPADLEISAHLVEMYSLCLSLLAGNYMHQNWERNPQIKDEKWSWKGNLPSNAEISLRRIFSEFFRKNAIV